MRKLGAGAHYAKMIFVQANMLMLMAFGLLAAIPTIVGERSHLSFKKVPGGLPSIVDHAV